MASNQRLNVYVTFVEKEGPFLKFWGQTDKTKAIFVEQFLTGVTPQFDAGAGKISTEHLVPGTLVCAKFHDNKYYRAKILNAFVQEGLVEVNFIDFGNKETISCEEIRSFQSFLSSVSSIPPLAMGFIVAEAHCVGGGKWNDVIFDNIAKEIKYREIQCTLLFQATHHYLVRISIEGIDICHLFIQKAFMQPISLQAQQAVLLSMSMQKQSTPQPLETNMASSTINTYKACTLKPGLQYPVYVSYVNDGPCRFSVQLKNTEDVLVKLMNEINSIELRALEETPLPGTICLARCQEDNNICRAVITTEVDTQFRVFFVDFGNYEVLPADSLFQIPFKYVLPKVMAIRFCLAGIEKPTVTIDMQIAFKKFVDNRLLHMKVLPSPTKTALPKCELTDPNTNTSALEVVMNAAKHSYPDPLALTRGFSQPVKVTFVYSCNRFYVQLTNKEHELGSLMENLQELCQENNLMDSSSIKPDVPCCALFVNDGLWYRSQVVEVNENNVKVRYVDYGNEELVPMSQLKDIDSEILTVLRPQAIECCLNGYQNMEPDEIRDGLLEELILEQVFTMKVVDMCDKKALVDLFDESNYNVASLLLDKLAAANSQMSPVLVVQAGHKLEHRKSYSKQREVDMKDKNYNSGREQKNWDKPNDRTDASWRQDNRDNRNFDKNTNENNETNSWRQNNKGFSPSSRLEKYKNRDDDWNSNENKSNSNSNWNSSTPIVAESGWNDTEGDSAWGDSNDDSKNRRNNDYKSNRGGFNDRGSRGGYTNNRDRGDRGGSDGERDRSRGERGGYRNDRGGPDSESDRSRGERGGFRNDRGGSDSERDRSRGERGGFRNDRGGRGGDKFGGRSREGGYQQRDFKKDGSDMSGSGSFHRGPRTSSRSDQDGKSYDKPKSSFKDYSSSGGGDSWEPVVSSEDSWNVSTVASSIDAAPAAATFVNYEIVGTESKVVISWFHNPGLFYCQLLGDQEQFKTMMDEIHEFYKDKKPEKVVQGSPAIGLFPEDNVLYRARVLDVTDNQYKVQYVDYGNVSTISKVWPIDKKFMNLPAQAITCCLNNIAPVGEKWGDPDCYSSYFDKENFDCKFVNKDEEKTFVNLTHNSEDVAQFLVRDGLAISTALTAPEIEIPILLGQQFRAVVKSVNNLSDIILALECGLAVSCTMHNLETATETFEETLKDLLEQTVIVYVDNVLEDYRLEITLYDTQGNKHIILDPDEGSYDTVDIPCPLLVLCSSIYGNVTFANETSIFIQPAEVAEQVAILLDQLFTVYDGKPHESTIIPEEGMIYAVHSEDSNWYRGKVTSFDDEKATVYYVDYGNDESVNFSELRELEGQFLDISILSLQVTVPSDAETFVDKDVSAIIYYGEAGWEGTVQIIDTENALILPETAPADSTDTGFTSTEKPEEIYDENLETGTSRENENVEVSEGISNEIETVEVSDGISNEIENVEVSDGGEVVVEDAEAVESEVTKAEEIEKIGTSVVMSHIDSPCDFYLQYSENLEDLDTLQAELQENVQEMEVLVNPTPGVFCAAPYTLDQMWYRAEVLDADEDITTVRFVDFGNTDVIDNKTTQIKTLPPKLLSLAIYATRCSLKIEPLEEDWSPLTLGVFETLTAGVLTAEFCNQDEKCTYVELYSDGVNIKDALVSENLAKLVTTSSETKQTGFVSHLNSPSEFWIQLESCIDELEWIAEQLSSAESFPEQTDLTPGTLCAALFPDDQMWYRARILSNTVAGVETLFIDYGNSCTSSDLKQLPEDLIMTAPLAMKCSLQKNEGIPTWSPEAAAKFAEISADGQTIFTVKKISSGETSVVQLYLDDKDVTTMLLPSTEDGYVTEIETLENLSIEKENGEIIEKVALEPMEGQKLDEAAKEKLEELNEQGSTLFQIEFVNDKTIRLYLQGRDIRPLLGGFVNPDFNPLLNEEQYSTNAINENDEEAIQCVVEDLLENTHICDTEIAISDSVPAEDIDQTIQDHQNTFEKPSTQDIASQEEINLDSVTDEFEYMPEEVTSIKEQAVLDTNQYETDNSSTEPEINTEEIENFSGDSKQIAGEEVELNYEETIDKEHTASFEELDYESGHSLTNQIKNTEETKTNEENQGCETCADIEEAKIHREKTNNLEGQATCFDGSDANSEETDNSKDKLAVEDEFKTEKHSTEVGEYDEEPTSGEFLMEQFESGTNVIEEVGEIESNDKEIINLSDDNSTYVSIIDEDDAKFELQVEDEDTTTEHSSERIVTEINQNLIDTNNQHDKDKSIIDLQETMNDKPEFSNSEEQILTNDKYVTGEEIKVISSEDILVKDILDALESEPKLTSSGKEVPAVLDDIKAVTLEDVSVHKSVTNKEANVEVETTFEDDAREKDTSDTYLPSESAIADDVKAVTLEDASAQKLVINNEEKVEVETTFEDALANDVSNTDLPSESAIADDVKAVTLEDVSVQTLVTNKEENVEVETTLEDDAQGSDTSHTDCPSESAIADDIKAVTFQDVSVQKLVTNKEENIEVETTFEDALASDISNTDLPSESAIADDVQVVTLDVSVQKLVTNNEENVEIETTFEDALASDISNTDLPSESAIADDVQVVTLEDVSVQKLVTNNEENVEIETTFEDALASDISNTDLPSESAIADDINTVTFEDVSVQKMVTNKEENVEVQTTFEDNAQESDTSNTDPPSESAIADDVKGVTFEDVSVQKLVTNKEENVEVETTLEDGAQRSNTSNTDRSSESAIADDVKAITFEEVSVQKLVTNKDENVEIGTTLEDGAQESDTSNTDLPSVSELCPIAVTSESLINEFKTYSEKIKTETCNLVSKEDILKLLSGEKVFSEMEEESEGIQHDSDNIVAKNNGSVVFVDDAIKEHVMTESLAVSHNIVDDVGDSTQIETVEIDETSEKDTILEKHSVTDGDKSNVSEKTTQAKNSENKNEKEAVDDVCKTNQQKVSPAKDNERKISKNIKTAGTKTTPPKTTTKTSPTSQSKSKVDKTSPTNQSKVKIDNKTPPKSTVQRTNLLLPKDLSSNSEKEDVSPPKFSLQSDPKKKSVNKSATTKVALTKSNSKVNPESQLKTSVPHKSDNKIITSKASPVKSTQKKSIFTKSDKGDSPSKSPVKEKALLKSHIVNDIIKGIVDSATE